MRLVTQNSRREEPIREDKLYPKRLASAFRSSLDRASALAVDDVRRVRADAEPVQEWLEKESIRAILALPVRAGGRLVGLVTFEEGRSPREWSSTDRDVANSFALAAGELLGRLSYDEVGYPSVGPQHEPPAMRTVTSLEAPHLTLEASPHSWVRSLAYLESAALLGAEEVTGLLSALDVQAGYLRMLEEATAERAEDRELVLGALEVRARLEDGLVRFLGCVREGVPDRVRVDLNRALPAMIPALAREVGEGARLRVAPTAGPLPIEANLTLLERALVHLVQNAREASEPEQSVRVSWGPAPQGTRGDPSWEGARIRVQDQGEGIPHQHLPWLFEPFFSSRTESHPLRGLGLSAVRAIVEGHGGWVEVRSHQGEGTEVDLLFPLAVSTTDEGPSESSDSLGAVGLAPALPARILILEDEPLLARLVSQILSRAGYEVEICATRQESERHWRKAAGRIHLMIVGRRLSGGRSGVEVGREWRRREPGLPVIVLDRHPAGRAGPPEPASDLELPLLVPPFEPGEIVRRVAELLEGAPEALPKEPSSAGGSSLTH